MNPNKQNIQNIKDTQNFDFHDPTQSQSSSKLQNRDVDQQLQVRKEAKPETKLG